jgi:hypothetical protein
VVDIKFDVVIASNILPFKTIKIMRETVSRMWRTRKINSWVF